MNNKNTWNHIITENKHKNLTAFFKADLEDEVFFFLIFQLNCI